MPKSKHRKKHKQALNKSKQSGGILAQIIESLAVPPILLMDQKVKKQK